MIAGDRPMRLSRQSNLFPDAQVAGRHAGIGRFDGRHHRCSTVNPPGNADKRITAANAVIPATTTMTCRDRR